MIGNGVRRHHVMFNVTLVAMVVRIAQEKALPFGPLVPNTETLAAMREARAGNLPALRDIESLMADLDTDD